MTKRKKTFEEGYVACISDVMIWLKDKVSTNTRLDLLDCINAKLNKMTNERLERSDKKSGGRRVSAICETDESDREQSKENSLYASVFAG